MLQKILEAIRNLFNALFGTKKPPKKVEPPKTTDPDKSNVNKPQDGADVKPDSTDVKEVSEEVPIIVDPTVPDKEFDTDDDDEDLPEEEFVEEKPAPDKKPKKDHKARYLWCLDNGHGQKTAGKRSPFFGDGQLQFREYEFNRDIVRRIVEALDEKGVQYYNVVPEVEIGDFLQGRVDRANNKRSSIPKVYVSIHANAGPSASMQDWTAPSINGIETWYYHGSKRGQKIASIFQKHLIEETGFNSRGLKSRARSQFFVIRKTRMTAILTENGFYNNLAECRELMKEAVRQQIADAHVKAIMEIELNGL